MIAALILILLGKGALEMLGVILNKPNAIITKPSLYFGRSCWDTTCNDYVPDFCDNENAL